MTAVSADLVGRARVMLELVRGERYLACQQGEDKENSEALCVQPVYVTEETQLTDSDRDNGTTLSANPSLNARSIKHFPVLPMQHISGSFWLD